MRRIAMLILLPASTVSTAGAACVASAPTERVHLVELYTSEGCSSCPPAERWLSTLRGKPGYAPLEFHVDYWDTDTWHDPYADARHAARQKESVRRSGRGIIYTPQVFVDGRLWKDWPKAPPPEPPRQVAPPLSITVTRGDGLAVAVRTAARDDHAVAVALTEDGLTNAVDGGENKGSLLQHDHVVRAFAARQDAGDFDAKLRLPRDIDLAHSSVVAFVQDRRSGDVVQVARLPLRTCLDGVTQAGAEAEAED
jgi:hypothetical protein